MVRGGENRENPNNLCFRDTITVVFRARFQACASKQRACTASVLKQSFFCAYCVFLCHVRATVQKITFLLAKTRIFERNGC